MDPHLSGLLVSGCSDYPDWAITDQLEHFVGAVCFIRVFEWSFVYKCMLQLSEPFQVSI